MIGGSFWREGVTMSGRERLMQAIQSLSDADLEGLSDAALVRVLSFIKSEVGPARLNLKAADDLLTELVAITEENGGYTVESCSFPPR